MRYLIVILLLVFAVGCQQKPTTALEESVDAFEPRTILVDTRSALDFASYHIKGSTNLLVEDFLILKNPLAKPQNQKRVFDSNLKNVVERLAARGIRPGKRIYLMGDKRDSIDNKKWQWLLYNLEIDEIYLYSIDQIRKMRKGNFAEIEKEEPWVLKSSPDFQKEFVLIKVNKCFADRITKWNDKFCK